MASFVLTVLLRLVLGDLLARRKELKKFRKECLAKDIPLPNGVEYLHEEVEFIGQVRHLLELADKAEEWKRWGALAVLRNTNPDIMRKVFPDIRMRIDDLWDEASVKFIDFLLEYQKLVVSYKVVAKKIWTFKSEDFVGIPESLKSGVDGQTWQFLNGTIDKLMYCPCFCYDASNCPQREDDYNICAEYGKCRHPVKFYNRDILGSYSDGLSAYKHQKYPDELFIFPKKRVDEFWNKKNSRAHDRFYEEVYDDDCLWD